MKLVNDVNITQPGSYHFYMIEHRTQLIDNNFNFLGMTEPQQLNYFNFDDNYDEVTYLKGEPNFRVTMNLSKKVVV